MSPRPASVENTATPLTGSVIHLLHRAGQVAEVVYTRVAGEYDLTPRQYAVLVAAAREPNISQIGLVRETGIDRSTLADIVKRLIRKGLLQRQRTKSDARMYAVRLSSKSLDVFEAASKQAAKADAMLLAMLPAADRAPLMSALQKLIDAYEAQRETAASPVAAAEPSPSVTQEPAMQPQRVRAR